MLNNIFFFILLNSFKDFDSLKIVSDLYYVKVMPEVFLVFSTFIFVCSLFGLVSNTENLIFSLVSMELLILSVSLNFIYFSVFLHQPNGQIFSILLLSVAASEAAVGLSLLLTASKMKNSLKITEFSLLKG